MNTPRTRCRRSRSIFSGRQVDVEAFPETYSWDFGDGETETTHHPGRPYPKMGVTHTYETLYKGHITLTVTWAGRYRVGDEAWEPIAGTATTSATSREFEVVERRAFLVTGTCDEDPEAPGC